MHFGNHLHDCGVLTLSSSMWPFKWNLSSSTFTWFFLLLLSVSISQNEVCRYFWRLMSDTPVGGRGEESWIWTEFNPSISVLKCKSFSLYIYCTIAWDIQCYTKGINEIHLAWFSAYSRDLSDESSTDEEIRKFHNVRKENLTLYVDEITWTGLNTSRLNTLNPR